MFILFRIKDSPINKGLIPFGYPRSGTVTKKKIVKWFAEQPRSLGESTNLTTLLGFLFGGSGVVAGVFGIQKENKPLEYIAIGSEVLALILSGVGISATHEQKAEAEKKLLTDKKKAESVKLLTAGKATKNGALSNPQNPAPTSPARIILRNTTIHHHYYSPKETNKSRSTSRELAALKRQIEHLEELLKRREELIPDEILPPEVEGMPTEKRNNELHEPIDSSLIIDTSTPILSETTEIAPSEKEVKRLLEYKIRKEASLIKKLAQSFIDYPNTTNEKLLNDSISAGARIPTEELKIFLFHRNVFVKWWATRCLIRHADVEKANNLIVNNQGDHLMRYILRAILSDTALKDEKTYKRVCQLMSKFK